MKIYRPEPEVSEDVRKVISLLDRIIDESINLRNESNLPSGHNFLTKTEAEELAAAIERVAQDNNIWMKLMFVDGIINFDRSNANRMRELYLSQRLRRGRSRAMSSIHWNQFLVRIGLGQWSNNWGQAATMMSFNHFMKMETSLLRKLLISESSIKYIEQKMQPFAYQFERDRIEVGLKNARLEFARDFRKLLMQLADKLRKNNDGTMISLNKAASIMVIIVDTSVFFTTRDWSAAGTLSAIAGASPHLFGE